MTRVLLALCALIGLAGCAAGTTAPGRPDPDLPVAQDAVRSDIMVRLGEMRLGSPFSL